MVNGDLLSGGGLPEQIRKLLMATPGDGVKLLQRAAAMPQDGILTRNQIVQIGKMYQAALCADFLTERAMSLIGQRHFDTNGREWLSALFRQALGL